MTHTNFIFRKAKIEDLPKLKRMFLQLVEYMNRNDLQIWDEIYPCCFLRSDIRKQQLYILTNEDTIVGAFVLCDTHGSEHLISWQKNNEKAMYLERLGVNVQYLKQGIGSTMLMYAKNVVKNSSVKYLRLFVVSHNEPAVRLYLQHGFLKKGELIETLEDGRSLYEYAYELKL